MLFRIWSLHNNVQVLQIFSIPCQNGELTNIYTPATMFQRRLQFKIKETNAWKHYLPWRCSDVFGQSITAYYIRICWVHLRNFMKHHCCKFGMPCWSFGRTAFKRSWILHSCNTYLNNYDLCFCLLRSTWHESKMVTVTLTWEYDCRLSQTMLTQTFQ